MVVSSIEVGCMKQLDKETSKRLFDRFRAQRNGVNQEPLLASVCLICGSIHIQAADGDDHRLVCRDCGFEFYRFECTACGKTIDSRDPDNPGCRQCGARKCTCGACSCQPIVSAASRPHKAARRGGAVDRHCREPMPLLGDTPPGPFLKLLVSLWGGCWPWSTLPAQLGRLRRPILVLVSMRVRAFRRLVLEIGRRDYSGRQLDRCSLLRV